MQQRQLRLGDILDDYCPRERRLTNHAVVAMVGQDVKQTRCTTCDAEHEYKHARVPRQRKKAEGPAALHPATAPEPKRVAHEPVTAAAPAASAVLVTPAPPIAGDPLRDVIAAPEPDEESGGGTEPVEEGVEEGPVHRPLIRATLPRPEGQPPPPRQAPDFTIRQPPGRVNRFKPRYPRGGSPFQGNRSNGTSGDPMRGARPNAGRSQMARPAKRHGGRKRSK